MTRQKVQTATKWYTVQKRCAVGTRGRETASAMIPGIEIGMLHRDDGTTMSRIMAGVGTGTDRGLGDALAAGVPEETACSGIRGEMTTGAATAGIGIEIGTDGIEGTLEATPGRILVEILAGMRTGVGRGIKD